MESKHFCNTIVNITGAQIKEKQIPLSTEFALAIIFFSLYARPRRR